jgi:hypothetical protein
MPGLSIPALCSTSSISFLATRHDRKHHEHHIIDTPANGVRPSKDTV